MKTFTSLAVLLAAFTLSACTTENCTRSPAPGKYESTSSSTDRSGTSVEKKKTTNVKVDSRGNKIVETETETSRDPEGLFNKKTSTSKTKAVIEND